MERVATAMLVAVGNEIIELQRIHFRQVFPVVALYQRGDVCAGAMFELDGHLAIHASHFGIVVDQIPFRGKFTHLFTFQIILKDDHCALNKVILHGFTFGSFLWSGRFFCLLIVSLLSIAGLFLHLLFNGPLACFDSLFLHFVKPSLGIGRGNTNEYHHKDGQ